MTGSDDNSSTRPISVAELLAKNGTIGAPPVGGRRRRRRGNADAVTVAELTGEIPIIRPDHSPPAPVAEPESIPQPEPIPEPEAAASTNGTSAAAAETAEVDTQAAHTVTDTDTAELDAADETVESSDEVVDGNDTQQADTADTDDEYAGTDADRAAEARPEDARDEAPARPGRRFGFGRFGQKASTVDAETLTPDPVDPGADESAVEPPVALRSADSQAPDLDDVDTDDPAPATAVTETDVTGTDAVTETDVDDPDDVDARDLEADLVAADDDSDELPSYLRSTGGTLFGGQSLADDLARRSVSRNRTDDRTDESPDAAGAADRAASVGAIDTDRDDDADADLTGDADLTADEEPRRMSPVVHAAWIVGQSVVAVVFGAGLFVAFDQLWKWNNIVALVLSVLVILGLVVGVRVVRRTEDIGSTLIAVAVGALVTLGPLALLQSG